MVPGPEYQDRRTLSAKAQLVSSDATPLKPDGQIVKSSTSGGRGGAATGGGAGALFGGGGGCFLAKMNAPGGVSHSKLVPSAVTSTGTS